MIHHLPRRRSVTAASALALATVVPGALPAHAAPPKNLLKASGLEQVGSNGVPSCWTRYATSGGTGTVITTKAKHGGKRAVRVSVSKGEMGLVQSPGCAPRVKAGYQYDLSVYYMATKATTVTLFRRDPVQGWLPWMKLASLPGTMKYKKASMRTPVVPYGTTHVRWAVTLAGTGTVVTDDYVMLPNAPAGLSSGRAACRSGTSAAACAKGSWKIVGSSGVRSIHSVLLRNGKVLLIAGSGNNSTKNTRTLQNPGQKFAPGTFTTQVYDPVKNSYANVPTPDDFFCAGHVQLPDGRVLVMGGTLSYPQEYENAAGQTDIDGFKGLRTSYIFDPATNKYTKTPNNMQQAHWYPSATEMGNGDIVSFGGWQDLPVETKAASSTEVFSFKNKTWSGATNVAIPWGTYPSTMLMQDGRLFYSGSYAFDAPRPLGTPDFGGNYAATGPFIFDLKATTQDQAVRMVGNSSGNAYNYQRDQSMSVLLPPAQDQRVMIMGGGDTNLRSNAVPGQGAEKHAHRNTQIIDLKKAAPAFKQGPNLPQGTVQRSVTSKKRTKQKGTEGKMYPSVVILPDGKVLETGGGLQNRAMPVFETSVYNPLSNKFTAGLATDPVPRTYHNMALLLPDGRVLTAGENPWGNSELTNFDRRISIYTPPYFYKSRPQLGSVPRNWKYGRTGSVRTSGPIARAALIRPMAVTHSSDPNQRYIDLRISRNGKNPHLTMVGNPNLAPPGYYMLVVVDTKGVPSIAKWIHLGLPLTRH